MEFIWALITLILGILIINRLFPKSSNKERSSKVDSNLQRIGNNFTTLEQVTDALRREGLESSNLILAIDYTRSNEYSGSRTFGGRSLHWIDRDGVLQNPYQQVISIIGNTLESFDDDKLIHAYGFGDANTTNKSCFLIGGKPCYRVAGVLEAYEEITPLLSLSGPTNFAPVIREAIRLAKENEQYYILVIIADGQVNNTKDTIAAIVEASHCPISIIMVGVGDGPWDLMHEFDDNIPKRQFDNFQFVDFHAVMNRTHTKQAAEAQFALQALMEIPMQFRAIKQLGLLDHDPVSSEGR